MKSRKRILLIGGVVVLAIAMGLLFGNLTGFGACRFLDGDDHPRFCDRGFHPRFGGKAFSEHILNRLDSAVKGLALTEAQEEEYEEIRQKIRSCLAEGMERRRHFFSELRSEINKEAPDVDAVVALSKEHLEHVSSFMEETLDVFAELYSILDEDQKARVIKKVRDRFGGV